MENELITFDDIDISLIQVNNLSEIIGGQVDIVKKLGEKVTEAMEKASGAKDSAQKAWLKETGWFQKKEAIESLQTAVKGIGEATEANAESQKIMYDYMQKIAQITKNLITIGCSSIAMNRATVRELELKLTGASKEKLSELAKKELLNVVTQLKQQEDVMSKQEQLTTEVHTQSKKLNNVEAKLTQKDDLDNQQSKQIKSLTDLTQQHQNYLKTKDEIDEEQSQRLKEIDTLLSKINKNIQDISSQISILEEYTKKNVDEIINRCQIVESENDALTQKLSEINTTFSEKYEEMTVALSTEREKLNTHSTHTEKSLTDVTNNFNDIHEEFKLYRENQHKESKKLVIMFSIFAVISFASTAYLFFK